MALGLLCPGQHGRPLHMFPIQLRTDMSLKIDTAANAKFQRLNLLCLNKSAAHLAPG